MNLKLTVVSVLTLFLLNSCTPKTEYIQPELVTLTTYGVKSIGNVQYETRKTNDVIEVVLKPQEFDRMVNWIKESSNANNVLNREIRKYNTYAIKENGGEE